MIAWTSPAFASSERPLRMSLPATRTWRLSIFSISILPLSTFEFVDISQVFRSPAGALVDRQVLDRDQRNTHSAELGVDPAWIAIIEFARRDRGQQVYPVRRSAQHQGLSGPAGLPWRTRRIRIRTMPQAPSRRWPRFAAARNRCLP